MVLYMIGLGLGDEGDITVKGRTALQQSDKIYLEAYTSVLPGLGREQLAELYGVKEIVEADRDLVESGCEEMLELAKTQTVSFLVVGDPLCATTHTDLWLRAKKRGLDVRVMHNASIMNAIASCGLQLYRFGETVSIPFWSEDWRPDSFYDKVLANYRAGLHTLCLLDIKVKEQSIENLMRGRKIYEPPRFMTVAQGLEQLVAIEQEKKQGIVAADSLVVGVARLGREDQQILFGKCAEMVHADLGGPLHSMVVCAPELHELEREYLEFFSLPPSAEAKAEAKPHWEATGTSS